MLWYCGIEQDFTLSGFWRALKLITRVIKTRIIMLLYIINLKVGSTLAKHTGNSSFGRLDPSI